MASKVLGLAYFKESYPGSGAYGVVPAGIDAAGFAQMMRLVDDSIDTDLSRQESNEIRSDAQSSGSIVTDAKAGGSFNLQWSLQTYDDLLPGLLYAADDAGTARNDGWRAGGFTPAAATPLASAGSLTWNFATNKFTATFTRAPLVGEKVFVTGFGNKNLDTIWEVASSPAPSTTEFTPVNDTGATDVSTYAGVTANVTTTTGKVVDAQGYARNGTAERSYGLVKFFSDSSLAGTTSSSGLTTVDWSVFRGQIPATLQLAAAPGQAGFTGSMTFKGKDEVLISNATVATQGYVVSDWNRFLAPTTVALVNTLQNVVMVRLKKITGAAPVAADYTRVDPLSLSLNLNNNGTEIGALRNLGAIAIQQGTFSATIALSLLYIDSRYHAAMLAGQAYEVELGLADSAGNCQLWRFPKCQLTSKRPNPGKNKPVETPLSFVAEAGGSGLEAAANSLTQSSLDTAGKMVEVVRFYVLT